MSQDQQLEIPANMSADLSGAQANQSNQPLKGTDGDMYAFNRPASRDKGLIPQKANQSHLNQTNNPDGEGSVQDLAADNYNPPGLNALKLKEDNGPSLGKPFDYDFDDLDHLDKKNGKLSCCKCMQMCKSFLFVLLFLGAVVGAFILPMPNNGKIKTVNSYIAATPLKEKDIQIQELALNYLVYFTLSKDQNSQTITNNLNPTPPANRRLQDTIVGSVDNIQDVGGVQAGGAQLTDKELATQLCNGVRIAIREDTKSGSKVFIPDCRVVVQDSSDQTEDKKLVVFNSFDLYIAVDLNTDTTTETIKVKDIVNLPASKQNKKLTFRNDQYTHQSLLILHDEQILKGTIPYKQYVFSTFETHQQLEPEVKLGEYQEKVAQINPEIIQQVTKEMMGLNEDTISSFDAAKLDNLIDNSNILLKMTEEQKIGEEKIRPQQINFQLYKNMTKGDTTAEDIINDSGFSYEQFNAFMHVEEVKDEGSNSENQMVADFYELIYESDSYTNTDYVINVGSWLVILCLAVVIIFSIIGYIFVNQFISELRGLIHRKYQQSKDQYDVEKLMKKFNSIHTALYDKRTEPEYKNIFKDLDSIITQYESKTYNSIGQFYKQMKNLDQRLPNIDDVEDMLQAVRFQQPAAQKLMDTKINKFIDNRSNYNLSKIGELIKKRLSLFSLFMLQDDFELNTIKMKAEMLIQNEKLEFLFKTLAERSERRSTRKMRAQASIVNEEE